MKIDKSLLCFLISTALAMMAHSLWYTLFPIYLEEKGLKLWEVGLASNLAFSLTFVLALPAGFASDVLSTRSALILASLGQLSALHAIRSLPPLHVMYMLLVFYTFGTSLRSQSAVRMMSVAGSTSSWALNYSIFLLVTGVARAAGSYLSGLIVERWGFNEAFTVSSILFATSALTSFIIRGAGRGSLAQIRVLKSVVFDRNMLALTLSLVIHDFAVFAVMSYTQIFQLKVVGMSPYQIGFVFALGTIVSQLMQLIAGYFTDKVGAKFSLLAHYLGVSAGYALIGLSRSFEEVALAVALQSAFIPFDLPARRKTLSLIAPREAVATVNGLSDIAVGLATLPSPLLGSYLWAIVGPRAMFICGSGLNLLALIPLAALRIKDRLP